ncbi:hypothetical protein CMV_025163 [Castanea mollissima]|uniref:Uncharacterized protein n=1 Tax=Castanea mollissima TaxID=60419 RepID=A0A8J4QF11_9ROSI|nr:hypothetical protein CMV_025163 [Castanea mollissima]
MVWTAASSSAIKVSRTGLPFQLIAAMSNPCSFRIMTPAPVLCKSSKTAPSKYSLYIASPAMTLGCFVDCSKTHLFLAFQIIQDGNCSTVLSQPSSNIGQNILTKSRNSCSNYLFSAAPNSLCLFTIP